MALPGLCLHFFCPTVTLAVWASETSSKPAKKTLGGNGCEIIMYKQQALFKTFFSVWSGGSLLKWSCSSLNHCIHTAFGSKLLAWSLGASGNYLQDIKTQTDGVSCSFRWATLLSSGEGLKFIFCSGKANISLLMMCSLLILTPLGHCLNCYMRLVI